MERFINVYDVDLKGISVFDENLDVLIPLSTVRKALQMTPTADVVPKSEVERWRRNLEAVLEEIPETKREVAREIFEEIEEAVEDAEFEWGTIYGVKLCLAELKKKRTEGKT